MADQRIFMDRKLSLRVNGGFYETEVHFVEGARFCADSDKNYSRFLVRVWFEDNLEIFVSDRHRKTVLLSNDVHVQTIRHDQPVKALLLLACEKFGEKFEDVRFLYKRKSLDVDNKTAEEVSYRYV